MRPHELTLEPSAPTLTASHRMVKCLWCREPVRLALAVKHQGICPQCLEETTTLAWRVIYDRDQKIGAIPENLRAAYNL